ncbi:tryptophan synthase alpha chain [Hypnocyclicus thermotrophus]|uniref:Tryptophan synthase alpha chain n=1 Tax=Hypnocyclicus thermotrophus TaxID=1627895 RepID=A0AA46I677_9FUSO|nr:tryptophan synthase subunit alpha [Hypnocyclicus thermotrophus]TDT71865.1 tryptophan synthase alpha chain [Hypnocyclicus thermotrophus]
MSRIKTCFDKLKKEHKTALITYLTAGDPNIKQTEKLIYAQAEAGVDIIEIGIPFSDPPADGPVIQRAAKRALDNGIKVDDIFNMVKTIRKSLDIPLVFLVYYNIIFSYGKNKFIKNCEEVGIDGLIIPDLPLEERNEILPLPKSIDLIPLVAPNSNNRIKDIVKDSQGFVYCVSSMGVTGVRDNFEINIENYLNKVKKYTDLPLAIGFGISKRSDVEKFEKIADGIIVGSAIVKIIEENNGDIEKIIEKVKELKNL